MGEEAPIIIDFVRIVQKWIFQRHLDNELQDDILALTLARTTCRVIFSTNLHEKQNDLNGQKQQIEKLLER